MVQRTALAFWHFPEWETVCQEKNKSHRTFPATRIFFPKPSLAALCAHLLSEFSCSCTARAAMAAVCGVEVYLSSLCVWKAGLWIPSKFLPFPWIQGRYRSLHPCWETPGRCKLGTELVQASRRPVGREKGWREGRCASPQGRKNWADIWAKPHKQFLPANPCHNFSHSKADPVHHFHETVLSLLTSQRS